MKISLFAPTLAVATLMSTAAIACPDFTIEGQQVDRFSGPDLAASLGVSYSFRTQREFGFQSCADGTFGYAGARASLSFYIADGDALNQIVIEVIAEQDLNGAPDCDTTLVVNRPDTRWYFDDDTNGVNPQLVIDNPGAQIDNGRYDVWVGAFNYDQPCNGVIVLSGS